MGKSIKRTATIRHYSLDRTVTSRKALPGVSTILHPWLPSPCWENPGYAAGSADDREEKARHYPSLWPFLEESYHQGKFTVTAPRESTR